MLTVEQAVLIQAALATELGEPEGIADGDGLKAVLGKPFSTIRGLPAYPTLLNKVAVLMQGLIYEKPFQSANREMALRCAQIILDEHGYSLRPDDSEFDKLAKGIEMGFTTWQRITVWLKRNTSKPSGR